MRGKRRSKNYRGLQRKQSKPDFTPVVIILCLAVGCGYATAKYVVDPVVNYVPELLAGWTEEDAKGTAAEGKEGAEEESDNKQEASKSASDKESEMSEKETADKQKSAAVVEDQADVKEKGDIRGYALQYGCYSSQKAAETAKKSLTAEGLQIIEQDGMFKITGKIYETKEEAKGALQKLEEDPGAFVTTIYE